MKQKVSVLSLGDQVYEPEYAFISPKKTSSYMLYKVFFMKSCDAII